MRFGGTSRRAGRFFAAALACLALGIYLHVEAGQERYDYDGLGRLIRRVDSQNHATGYSYDAAGNIVRVTNGADTAQPPSITQVTPTSIRRGESRTFTIVGTNLAGVGVAADSAALDVRDVRTTPTQVVFTLAVAAEANVGTHTLRLGSASGAATASVSVAPVLPTLTVEPTPLAIPPDGVSHLITLRLSNADLIAHTVALAASSSKIAVSPPQITFAAGQTTATASVTGVAAGTSNILMTSATLGASGVPVYVTADFRGISTSHAQLLGVVLDAPPAPVGQPVSPLVGRLLGVAVGNYVEAMAPSAFVVGSAGQLVVSGMGLSAATAVGILPVTGVTVGALSASPDGKTLTVPFSIAADAPLGVRQVVVADAAGKAFPVAKPDADRVSIVRAGPQIDSIEPLFATRGTTTALVVRGRNLQEAKFSVTPNADMAVGNDPVIASDGTQARVQVYAGLAAALGNYAIVAETPGGSSSSSLSSSNAFRVVNEIREAVTPITALPLGVVLQDATVTTKSHAAYARPLGVAVGSVVTGVSPAAGIIGTTMTLTLQGSALQGITAVQFNPATGLTVGAVNPAPDGKSATVDLVIAADAPRTPRALKVLAGAAEVPFGDPGAMQFLVTAPLPSIASVAPNAIQAGLSPQTLTITGSNLKDASAVAILPPDNLSVSTPTVNADATQITVNIAAGANAAVGPRIVTVVTPAGQSSSVASAANSLIIGQTVTPGPSPLLSPLVGVVLEGAPAATGPTFLAAPNLGVVLETATAPEPPQRLVTGGSLGVVVGPATTELDTLGFAPGSAAVLTVNGFGLNGVDAITVTPSDGITLGTTTVAVDGKSASAPITVSVGATALIPRRVAVSAAGIAIPDAQPAAMTFQVGPGIPAFDSISPILAKQGDKLTMTIRGQNFSGAVAVTATPPEGIVVSNTVTVDSTGKILTVDLYVSPDAPLGARVIRVWVPGAGSDGAAAPDNTFTVYAP